MECNNYMFYLLESAVFIIVNVIVIRIITLIHIALLRRSIQEPRGSDFATHWLNAE